MGKNRRSLTGDIESRITVDGDMVLPKSYSNINKLSDLSDVDISSVEDGQILKYDAEIEKWVPGEGSGPSITIDNEMSDSSENAVQNKVIKRYVDDAVTGDIEASSFNGMQVSMSEETISDDTVRTFTFS